MDLGRDHRCGRISAHTARVGSLVPIGQAFVVLRGCQGNGLQAVAHHDEAGLFALQKFLDHHARATLVVRHAQFVVQEHEVNGFMGLLLGHGHHHAFASRQAIGLHHDGRTLGTHIVMRGLRV